MSSGTFSPIAAVLSVAAALSIVGAASGSAQAADDMTRCSELYSLYNKYEGASRMGTASNAGVAGAFNECQKGNYTAGIADLTKALDRERIAIPDTETAKARR